MNEQLNAKLQDVGFNQDDIKKVTKSLDKGVVSVPLDNTKLTANFNKVDDKTYFNNFSKGEIRIPNNFNKVEAVNLSEGKSVNKTFTKNESSWDSWAKINDTKLDFYTEKYVKTEDVLDKYKIKLDDKQMVELKAGNDVPVKIAGADEVSKINFNPQYKGLVLKNEEGKALFHKFDGGELNVYKPLKKKESNSAGIKR